MIDIILYVIFYQTIIVNQTQPCFLNDTAGIDMWQNCGMGKDYLKAVMLSWEWVTGGWFSMLLVTVFVLVTYIKYHKIIFPIMIGIIFLPISYFVFPEQFLSFAVIMAFTGIGCLIWWIFVSQTNEG